jgi:hypothetical protein
MTTQALDDTLANARFYNDTVLLHCSYYCSLSTWSPAVCSVVHSKD